MKINWPFVLFMAFISGAYVLTKNPQVSTWISQGTPSNPLELKNDLRDLCDEKSLMNSNTPVTGKVVEQFSVRPENPPVFERPHTSYTLSDGRCEVTVLTSVFEQGRKIGIPSEQSLEGQYLTVTLREYIGGELYGNIVGISKPQSSRSTSYTPRTWENIEDEVPPSNSTPVAAPSSSAAPAAQPHFRNYTITTTQTAEYMEQFRDYNDNLGFTDTRGEKFLIPARIRDKFPAKGTYTTMTLYAYNAEVYRISYR
jgi:hypothetical protein